MRALGLATILLTAILAAGCGERADAQTTAEAAADGAPYVLKGAQVWSVPDPVSGRDYEVFVSLPASYGAEPTAAIRSSMSPTPTTLSPSSARSPGG